MIVLATLLFAVGCEYAYNQANDPNSVTNKVANTVEMAKPILDIVVNTTAVTPYGTIAGVILGVLGVISSGYQTWRKKLVANKFINLETTTKTIIGAIEDLAAVNVGTEGNTLGKIVKGEIGKKLEDYEAGKAIISGIKAKLPKPES